MARLPILADFLYLHNLLTEKTNEHQSFEVLSQNVQKKFQKNDFLSVGTLLTLLLKQHDLPETTNRLVAYYILYDMFRVEGTNENESPFSAFLYSLVDSKESLFELTCIERNFIFQLLTHGVRDLCKQTPHQHSKKNDVPPTIDLSQLKKYIIEKQKELPASVKSGMLNCIPARVPTVSDSAIRELMEGMYRRDTPLKSLFRPEFMTIAPPLLPVDDELVWFDITNPVGHKPVFDLNMIETQYTETEAKKLVALSFKQALSLQDQKVLESELEKDADLVYHIGLTPKKLPELVENNPMIAIKILLMLMNSSQITEYFSVLVNMEMSLHSMEVVNRLSSIVDLPSEFVHLYISNCITTCESIQENKYLQNRLVRLVCVFLQSLIRNKIINVKELFIEVEGFCIEFSRIREAAALYRLLKQVEEQG
ncbi:unnamed protein product [Diamesa hyperborea]